MARDWEQQVNDTFQPHVPEPIDAVGMLQPAGAMGSFGVGRVSLLASVLTNADANERAGGLAKTSVFRSTKSVAIVLTPSNVFAFAFKQKGYKFVVKDRLAMWDRPDVRFTVEPKGVTTQVSIDVISSGEHYELEAVTKGTRGFHEPFFNAISK